MGDRRWRALRLMRMNKHGSNRHREGDRIKLRDTVDVWFSELENNWEECGFYWFSRDRRKNEHYRRYGDLPDGRHFGAGFIPAFGDPWARESAIIIVGETGELQRDTPSRIRNWDSWPKAMAISPGGRSLVWLTGDNKLGVWRQGKEDFDDWHGEILNERLDDRSIADVRMNTDGILEIRCGDGEIAGFFCDADLVLDPWKNGWIPKAEECQQLSYALKKGYLKTCPAFLTVMICAEDCWGEYAGRGVRQVAFAPGLERIEGSILADNPDLESVVIPASVRFVDWQAFGGCTNLKHLVIEGDLSRVGSWDKDAFKGCPCEEYYAMVHQHACSS